MQAIHRACSEQLIDAEITLVISNTPDAGGLTYCRQHDIEYQVIDHTLCSDREQFDSRLSTTLAAVQPDFVLLAGFMRLLTRQFTETFANRLLNIHPSLLPEYPGLNTHQRVISDGLRWHGCSVHLVTDQLDAGPIVARSAIRVEPGITAEQLAAQLLSAEHKLYAKVISECVKGNIRFENGQVSYLNQALSYPILI